MNDILPFTYEDHPVRVLQIDGEPWFVLGDLCMVLGIRNSRMVADRLDSDGVSTTDVIDSMGRTQHATVVDEGGMYEVILLSRKPEAKAFKRWITSEVLPQIRKTGAYGTPALPDLTSLEGISAILDAGKAALNRAQAAEARALELEGPAAQATTMRQADGLRTITDLANDLKVHAASNFPNVKVHRDDVFNLAGQVGLIIRGNTVRNNQPTARAIEAGWVKPKNHEYETKTHGTQSSYYARLTPRGYGRLWDAAITNLNTNHEVFTPKKEIAA